MNSVDTTLGACDKTLRAHYGSRYRGLQFFGSLARGEGTPESDIDVLVLLQEPLDVFQELHHLTEMLYPIQLETERLISAKPVPAGEFYKGSLAFYRHALSEGKRIA